MVWNLRLRIWVKGRRYKVKGSGLRVAPTKCFKTRPGSRRHQAQESSGRDLGIGLGVRGAGIRD